MQMNYSTTPVKQDLGRRRSRAKVSPARKVFAILKNIFVWLVAITAVAMMIFTIISVLTFVNNFNAFDIVFAMENVNGAPEYSTDLIGTLFYRYGIAELLPGNVELVHGPGCPVCVIPMGRIDDVIKVAGYRLGTAEIESALVSHHAVADLRRLADDHAHAVVDEEPFADLGCGMDLDAS